MYISPSIILGFVASPPIIAQTGLLRMSPTLTSSNCPKGIIQINGIDINSKIYISALLIYKARHLLRINDIIVSHVFF